MNLNLLSAITVGVAKAGMLSSKGQCHTLDELADGYVRSEGCAALLLLNSDAKQAEHAAVVVSQTRLASSAVRSDGVSASLTAPNGSSQQRLLEAVSGDGRPALEAHGTGTALGDPIEVRAAFLERLVENVFPRRSARRVGRYGHRRCAPP